MATAGVWITARAPGVNVSYTDVLIALAGTAALVTGIGQTIDPRGRVVLRSFAIYLGALSVTLAFNQSVRSDFEWVHRIALVAGAVLVGAWLVRAGLHHSALRALLLVTTVISTFAVVVGASSGFANPAQPFGYQKNFVGSISATVLLVLLAAHREFRLPSSWLRISSLLIAGGLVASHSRGAMIAFAVGALIWSFRSSSMSTPRLRRLAIVGVIALVVFTGVSVKNELNVRSPFTSFNQRVQVEHATARLWKDHPLTGVGLRFFKTPSYASYQPPNNVFNEILAEAGILGLMGFVVFVSGPWRTRSFEGRPCNGRSLRRRSPVRAWLVRHLLDGRNDDTSMDRCWNGSGRNRFFYTNPKP